MNLQYIGQELTIYVGYCLLITGIIGNGINIRIFSKYNYRKTPCTFYFLIGSICNMLIILINLSSRLLTVGYEIDWISTSIVWCKIRQFSLVTTSFLTVTCSSLATIDQFLVTSRSQSLRICSQIKWAYRMLAIATIISLCNGIPYLLYYNVSPITNSCVNINPQLSVYFSFHVIGILLFIPISIMSLFSWLTYRNIRQIIVLTNQHVDHQLVKMTLFQVGLIIISFLPYGTYTVYKLVTQQFDKNKNQVMIETFISTIMSLLAYLFHSVNIFVKKIIRILL